MIPECPHAGVNTGMALGRQMTVEFYECDSRILADTARMEGLFRAAAKAARATVISSHFHAFAPQGVSGVVIISESHFTVHAWPEHDYAAVDIFTCGETIDFDIAVAALKEGMASQRAIISGVMNRGIVSNHGMEQMVTVCEDQTSRYALSWRSSFERIKARAISAAIDLYDCRREDFSAPNPIADLTAQIAKILDAAPAGSFRKTVLADGQIALQQDFGCATLSAKLDPATGNAYIDLYSTVYFEPRLAAETAIASLDGAHYRMQIAIRQ